MGFFEWSDRFYIGVHEMNMEHRHLLDLMNRLYDYEESHASTRNIDSDSLLISNNAVLQNSGGGPPNSWQLLWFT